VLAARREALVALSTVQREVLVLRWRGVEPSLQWAERGFSVWQRYRGLRWLLLVPVAGLLLARPRLSGRVTAAVLGLMRVRQLFR
jgi:hypothetical protein